MRIPRAGWWILAPLSWVWQYGAYVPSHLLWNLLNILIGLGDARAGIIEPRPRLRPWFIERLR
jgi:hypothetical protein